MVREADIPGFLWPRDSLSLDQPSAEDAAEVERQTNAQRTVEPVRRHPEGAVVVVEIDAIAVALTGEGADASLTLDAVIVAAELNAACTGNHIAVVRPGHGVHVD